MAWEENARLESRDHHSYQSLVQELLFQSDLRYGDYLPHTSDGEFPVRLKKWLSNLSDDRQQQAALRLLRLLVFIDRRQVAAISRDILRRHLVPLLLGPNVTPAQLLDPGFDDEIQQSLSSYCLLSITDSFNWETFIHGNSLSGLPKPRILGERTSAIQHILPEAAAPIRGLLVFEDFVGTGKQAGRILQTVATAAPNGWELFFLPFVILESGQQYLVATPALSRWTVLPGLIINTGDCLLPGPRPSDSEDHAVLRTLIRTTAKRVLEPLDRKDDAPTDALGYRSSGSMAVLHHNTPNNTLPMIHHKAPDWQPLFRRVHHSKDGF
jgi:hypothetical protein